MATLKVVNPATGKLEATLPADDAKSVRAKYERARAAQPKWAKTRLKQRLDAIRKFRELVVAETETLARVLTTEVGKPISQSRNELKGLLPRIDFFLEETAHTLRTERVGPKGAMEERISHEPLGVIANISAWNYPWFVGGNVFIPALLAGNAVLYKPSEYATLTGLAIADLLYDAGVPREVFATVVGGGEVGAALLEERIDGVYFTGSYGTGRKIAETVAGRLIRVQLELGGKDPAYVCDDVDVAAAAAATAEGAFYNAGQSCCAVERVYVHRAIAAGFTERFVEAVRGYTLGDPTDEGTFVGPLARRAQLDVLQDQVDDAVRKGARLLLGGRRVIAPMYVDSSPGSPTLYVLTSSTNASTNAG